MVNTIASKIYMAKNNYNLVFRSTPMTSDTYIAAQFFGKTEINKISESEEKLKMLSFDKKEKFVKEEELKITFYRNQKCSRQILKIKKFTKNVYTFIQLDKGIYKPGDTIQYRVVMLNNFLKPFNPNEVSISLINPDGISVACSDDKRLMNTKGIFESTFKLDPKTKTGDWTVKVLINNDDRFAISKTFKVQKYVLPLFDVYIKTETNVLFAENKLSIDVEARYSFGELVKGSASVDIFDIADVEKSREEWVLISMASETKEVTTTENFQFTLKEDLKMQRTRTDPHKLLIKVTFKDSMNLQEKSKSEEISIHNKLRCNLEIVNVHPYEPNLPLRFDILIENFRGGLMMDEKTPVQATIDVDGQILPKSEFLKNGLASFRYDNLVLRQLNVNVKFGDRCSKTFEVKSTNDGRTGDLLVYHSPER